VCQLWRFVCLCVSHRHVDALVGHDVCAELEFDVQPVNRRVSVVCCGTRHSMLNFVARAEFGVPSWPSIVSHRQVLLLYVSHRQPDGPIGNEGHAKFIFEH
jgi:hypothetical protein